MTCTIEIYGAMSMIKGDFPFKEVREATSYMVDGAQFSPKFRKGFWDGRTHLMNKKTGAFPTGLVPYVIDVLKEEEVEYEIKDHRPIPVSADAGFELKGKFQLRDYQLNVCKAAVEKKQGIIKMATGAGKTVCAAAIIKCVGLNTLFLVTSKELLYQAEEEFREKLGLDGPEVGLVGDGHWDPGTWITIAIIDTVHARLGDEKCKELLDSTDVLFADECVHVDSIVSMGDGSYKKAKDVNVGDSVLTETGVGTVTGKAFREVNTGIKVTTERGNYVKSSLEHPFAALGADGAIEYVPAEQLNVGCILFEKEVHSTLPQLPFSGKAYILGLFAGDGSWPSKNRVRWSYRKDYEFWEGTVCDVLQSTFSDAEVSISENARGDRTLTVNSSKLCNLLESCGYSPECSKTLDLNIPEEFHWSFISGFYDAEGYLRKDDSLEIDSCSEGLMLFINRFLRDQGILTSFSEIKRDNSNHSSIYRCVIAPKFSGEFLQKAKPKLRRKTQLRREKHYSSQDLGANRLFKEFLGTSLKHKKRYHIVPKARKNFSWEEIKEFIPKLCEEYELSYPAWFTTCRVSESKPTLVTELSYIHNFTVVNFSVDTQETFYANGILTHNCHGVGADQYYDVAVHCNAYYRFACSGTPYDRGDSAGLRLIAAFGHTRIANVTTKYLVDRGFLPKAQIIFDRVATPVLKKGIKYPTAYKQGVVENEDLLAKVVKWTECARKAGLNVLILIEEINHGRIVDEALWSTEEFIPHMFIHGTEKDRMDILKDFSERKLPVLIASSILDTGVSTDAIDVLILAGSKKSKIKTVQRLGRGLRGDCLVVVEFANYTNKHLVKHSMARYQDYKAEECFGIHPCNVPSPEIIKKLYDLSNRKLQAE